MTSGPTTGAKDASRQWTASPVAAITVRVVVAIAPFAAAWFVVAGFTERFWRPAGPVGLAIWLVQALVTGISVSMATEHFARRLMPLASLFNMTLVFPDQAPSRFGVALRSGTVKQLKSRYKDVKADGLGSTDAASGVTTASSAAATALELIGLLSRHDRLTRGHTERVRAHAILIAEEMGVSAADRELLTWGAMLHDIGKLTVSPEILNKPGKPTDAEWAELQGHPAAASKMLAPLQDWLGDWALAASEHHERWDGTGYPAGLAGTEISLAGRITAVADAYDVITSRRSYKKPMPVEAARKELIRCAGTQFDPDVVRAFLNVSLRRRWASGPLASLVELPKALNLGASLQTTAVVVAGATATVGTAALAPPAAPVELASTAPPIVESFEPEPTTEPVERSEVVGADSSGGLSPVSSIGPIEAVAGTDESTTSTTMAPTSDANPALEPSATETTQPQNTDETTASTFAGAISTLPRTTAPTTIAPTSGATAAPKNSTTAPATTTITTTTAPTTTAPTTTTAAPTTATTAPTTTTTTTAPTTTAPTTTTTAPTTTIPPGSPVAVNDTESVKDNKDLNIKVLDNDDEGNSAFDESTLEIVSPPEHFKDYRVHNDHLHYKSEKDFSGTVTIVYRICNTNGLCDNGLVTITVE